MEKKRIEWIDSLKGALMIGVIWSHSSANTGGGYWLTACYMAAFYFISGYISGNKNQKLSVFLKEKAKRLLFPYFVYGVALVGIDVTLSGTQGSLNKLIGVFYSRYMLFPHDLNNNVFFLKSYNSILWFLTSMFLTSICFDAFRKCQRKKIFVSILFVLGYVLMYLPVLLPWSIDSVPVTTLVMIAGYYFRGVSLDSFSVKNKMVALIVLLPIYLICITINQGINLSIREYGSDGIKGYLFYYIISLIGAVILMILFSVLPILKGLIFVGRHTMTYMCLQIFTLAMTCWNRKLRAMENSSQPELIFAKMPTEQELSARDTMNGSSALRIFITNSIRVEIMPDCPQELLHILIRSLKENA